VKLPFINKKNNTELSTKQMQEMGHFYLMLLKMQKRRPPFTALRVMREVYSDPILKTFFENYKKGFEL